MQITNLIKKKTQTNQKATTLPPDMHSLSDLHLDKHSWFPEEIWTTEYSELEEGSQRSSNSTLKQIAHTGTEPAALVLLALCSDQLG